MYYKRKQLVSYDVVASHLKIIKFSDVVDKNSTKSCFNLHASSLFIVLNAAKFQKVQKAELCM